MLRLRGIAFFLVLAACSSDSTTGNTGTDGGTASSSSGGSSSGSTSGTPANCDPDGGAPSCGAAQICGTSTEPDRLPICYVKVDCGTVTCASGTCGQACETSPCDAKIECLK